MADYYTKFSTVLSLPNDEAEKYALQLHETCLNAMREDRLDAHEVPEELRGELETWCFEVEHDGSTSPGLWLHDGDGCGSVSACASFIQHLLAKYLPLEHAEFEYSNDCSKPRLDGYGGGAVFITASSITSFSTYEWLDQRRGTWVKTREFIPT